MFSSRMKRRRPQLCAILMLSSCAGLLAPTRKQPSARLRARDAAPPRARSITRHRKKHTCLRAASLDLPRAAAPDASEAPPGPIAVMMLNLGGPETSADVEPFLYNLFADPDIIRLPPAIAGAQTAIAWLIAKRRAPKSRAAYDAIGGGSPITMYTNEQARLLEEALNAGNSGLRFKTYVAMRYWHPFTDEAMARATADGCTSAVVLPLYPHFSISTTGSSLRALLAEMQAAAPELMQRHTVVPSWQNSPGYVDVVAKLVAAELEDLKSVPGDVTPTVLFSAHGVPVSYVEEAGDPYKRHIEETVRLVTAATKRRLGDDCGDFELAFQSRVGPVKWLEPYTDEALEKIGARGCDRIVVVPISFVSEHIETLEEIDMEYREVAEEAGVKHWRRVPALNLDEDFIAELAKQVRGALAKPVVSSVEACVVNAFDLTETPVGVLPGMGERVEFINGRTLQVAITLGVLFELLADSRFVNVMGVGAI
mmetsp:Transcript_8329/g.25017  ORF Transcript_8329/g.25017 Transcript_8329/m.25017 type:complete len:482 (+) Transcript_8329:47-1492(+)